MTKPVRADEYSGWAGGVFSQLRGLRRPGQKAGRKAGQKAGRATDPTASRARRAAADVDAASPAAAARAGGAMAVAMLVTALLNADGLVSWSYDLTPSPAADAIVVAAESWSDAVSAAGFSAVGAPLEDAAVAARAWRWPGAAASLAAEGRWDDGWERGWEADQSGAGDRPAEPVWDEMPTGRVPDEVWRVEDGRVENGRVKDGREAYWPDGVQDGVDRGVQDGVDGGVDDGVQDADWGGASWDAAAQ